MDTCEIVLQQFTPARARMRISVVTETYPPEINGVAMTISRMIAGLQAREHQVQLIRPRQDVLEQPAREPAFEEVLQRGLAIPRYASLKLGLPARQALLRLWALRRPDIVHVVTEGPLGWSALAAASKLRIPCSSDFHTNFHAYSRHYGVRWLKKPIIAYLRRFHNEANCTLVPTQAMLEELAAHGYENLRVVARGVDTRLFNPDKRSPDLRGQWGAEARDPVALYVGRIAPEKNMPVVLQAYHRMRSACPRAQLVIVGDGPDRRALQRDHPEVRFAGMRTGEDLATHYASADVFLFPSVTETFGNVTVEAMASGLAVIAFDYAAAHEHIRHGVNGLCADTGNAGQFAALARDLASDAERIAALGRQARETAARIDWETVHDEFERVLLAASNAARFPAQQVLVAA